MTWEIGLWGQLSHLGGGLHADLKHLIRQGWTDDSGRTEMAGLEALGSLQGC